jgi:hypothetical protein
LVKGDNISLYVGIEDFEGEIRRGEGAGDGDAHLAEVVSRELAAGDDHGAVALAHAAPTAHEGIV